MTKPLKERLKEVMQIRGVKVPELSRQTGIPAPRIYKWYDENTNPKKEDSEILEKWISDEIFIEKPIKSFRERRLESKLGITRSEDAPTPEGVPVYDVPIDASFIERFRDEQFKPLYWVNIPKLRNCNFGAIVSGNSMYPVLKSGSIAMCRVVENLDYFDPGEMYFLSTVNGFETVKYVQMGDNPDELLLIPHNEKIKPRPIHKSLVLKMCIVEAWISFR